MRLELVHRVDQEPGKGEADGESLTTGGKVAPLCLGGFGDVARSAGTVPPKALLRVDPSYRSVAEDMT